MFDIGWTELLVIAVVLIVVVGPKDLPPMLRAFGKMTANFRKMAGDFRAQFDEALRESELDDVRKTIADVKSLNPTNALRDAINPLRQMGQDIRSDLQKSTQVSSSPEMTPTDVEAQQSVEGAPVGVPTPEVPSSIAPAAAPAAQAAEAVAAAAKEKKPRAPRKSAVEKAVIAPVTSEAPVKAATVRAKKTADIAAITEKPKRVRAVAKPAPVVETVEEVIVVKVPRKRTPKKTETPKDDA